MVMENDNVMIVMEMVNGGGLDHHLKKSNVKHFSFKNPSMQYRLVYREATKLFWTRLS